MPISLYLVLGVIRQPNAKEIDEVGKGTHPNTRLRKSRSQTLLHRKPQALSDPKQRLAETTLNAKPRRVSVDSHVRNLQLPLARCLVEAPHPPVESSKQCGNGGFPKLGVPFCGPNTKDYSIWDSMPNVVWLSQSYCQRPKGTAQSSIWTKYLRPW